MLAQDWTVRKRQSSYGGYTFVLCEKAYLDNGIMTDRLRTEAATDGIANLFSRD